MFPLDADEFLCVTDKDDLRLELQGVDKERVLQLVWKNIVPLSLVVDQELTFTSPLLIPPFTGAYEKVAVHASAYVGKGYQFVQGNHALRDASGQALAANVLTNFADLYHVPLRSVDHFAVKCIQGVLAYEMLPPDRKEPTQGPHWFNMVRGVLQDGHVDENAVREFAVHYGLHNSRNNLNARSTIYGLIDDGWVCGHLDVAHDPPPKLNRRLTFGKLANQMLEEHSHPQLEEFFRICVSSVAAITDALTTANQTYADQEKRA